MRYFILLLCFIYFSCNTSTVIQPTTYELGKAYTLTLKFGQTQYIKSLDLQVGFRDVLQDSRCPAGARCFWVGKADLGFLLYKPNLDTVFVRSSIYGNVDKNNNRGQVFTDTLGYRIKILQVDPYPRTDTVYQKSDYIALLEISTLVLK